MVMAVVEEVRRGLSVSFGGSRKLSHLLARKFSDRRTGT